MAVILQKQGRVMRFYSLSLSLRRNKNNGTQVNMLCQRPVKPRAGVEFVLAKF